MVVSAPQPSEERTVKTSDAATDRTINHIWVLVGLTVAVLGLAILVGLSGYLGLCAFPIVLFIASAGLSRWLGWSEDFAHYGAADAWQPTVNATSAELGIVPPPQVLVVPNSAQLNVVGSFRRKHMLVGSVVYEQLKQPANTNPMSANTRDILVYHEMRHVVSKDLEALGGLQFLLNTFTWASVWSAVCAIGAIGCLMLLAPPIFDLAATDPALQEALAMFANLYDLRPVIEEFRNLSRAIAYSLPFTAVIVSFLPVLAGCGLLNRAIWHRLMQLRELYADQSTVARFGESATREAFARLQTVSTFSKSDASTHEGTHTFPRWKQALQHRAKLMELAWTSPDTHPNPSVRRAAMRSHLAFPDALTEPRVNGITIGIALLSLSLLTTSAFNLPATALWLPFIIAIAAHLTLTALVVPALGDSVPFNLSSRLRTAALLASTLGFGWLIAIGVGGLLALRWLPEMAGNVITTLYRAVLGLIEHGPDGLAMRTIVQREFIRLVTHLSLKNACQNN